MSTGCIHSIDITTNNNDTLSISSDDFENFYIANLDEKGDEISYSSSKSRTCLYANFFMIKLINKTYNKFVIKRLHDKNDITKITLKFTNGKYQDFELATKRVLNDGVLENVFQKSFKLDGNLCILISDKRIKFMDNLFI